MRPADGRRPRAAPRTQPPHPRRPHHLGHRPKRPRGRPGRLLADRAAPPPRNAPTPHPTRGQRQLAHGAGFPGAVLPVVRVAGSGVPVPWPRTPPASSSARHVAGRRCAARCLPARHRRWTLGLPCIRLRRLSGRAEEGGRLCAHPGQRSVPGGTDEPGTPGVSLPWAVCTCPAGRQGPPDRPSSIGCTCSYLFEETICLSELPVVFRTGNLRLFHAASCPFRYSSRTSCGVRYPSVE